MKQNSAGVIVGKPHRTRRATCAMCQWADVTFYSFDAAMAHCAERPEHAVTLVETSTRQFAGPGAAAAVAARRAAANDKPAF